MRQHLRPTPFINAEGAIDGLHKVRDPETGEFIPDTGATVTVSSYWARRLRDGSVEAVDSDTPAPGSMSDMLADE